MPKTSTKDPNKPKGPKNLYNFFLQEERETMKKSGGDSTTEGNGLGFLEFSKACAEKWKSLNEEEKQSFKESAEKDKIRYENEMANYTPPKTEASGRKTRKAKRIKDPNQPKPAMNAFMYFSTETRSKLKEEHPGTQTKEISKILGEMWGKMSDKEKGPHQRKAKEDKERYDEEMKAFRKGDYVVPSTSMAVDMVEAEE